MCVKPTCRNYADCTLTNDYEARVMVIGPLTGSPVQGGLDLCSDHAARTTAPQGWQIVRSARTPADRG